MKKDLRKKLKSMTKGLKNIYINMWKLKTIHNASFMKDNWKPAASSVYMTDYWIVFKYVNSVIYHGLRVEKNTATKQIIISFVECHDSTCFTTL